MAPRWLLLIHQLPPTPAYLRVRVRRRLKQLGAQLLKNSVYVLPHSAEALEDFHWLRREILDAGGEATITAADFVEGTSDRELEHQFRQTSDAEYQAFTRSTQSAKSRPGAHESSRRQSQLRDIAGRDFFDADGRADAERALSGLTTAGALPAARPDASTSDKPAGATWVTRADVHVDRLACAWLIKRFIDPAATFRFVNAATAPISPGELRFDMFEGEFTHGAGRCTFQTLVQHFALTDPALSAIGEVIHDIDYKVEPSRREETEGVRALVHGICLTHDDDQARIEMARPLFDGLYAHMTQAR
jgi:hypothetical protein